MEFFVEPDNARDWHQYWIDARLLVHRPRHRPGQPAAVRAPEGQAVALLGPHRRHRVPLRLPGQPVGRAGRRRQPHRLRPVHALQAFRRGPVLLRPDHRHPLRPVRDRACGRPDPLADGVPGRRVRRGRGAQRQGRRGQANRVAARPPAGSGQGRGAAAVPARQPVAEGERPGRRTAPALERRIRRRRRHRPPVPPPGRDRHTVLRHRRLRHPRRPSRDRPRTRRHDAGPRRDRRSQRLSGGAAARAVEFPASWGHSPRKLGAHPGCNGNAKAPRHAKIRELLRLLAKGGGPRTGRRCSCGPTSATNRHRTSSGPCRGRRRSRRRSRLRTRRRLRRKSLPAGCCR